jgi:Asparagine synthase
LGIRESIDDHRTVAVMVSGGVDSSGVLAATVAELRGATKREVHALTWDFGGYGDDRPYMNDLARSLGIVPVKLPPARASQNFSESFVVGGAPYTLTCGAMELATFEEAARLGATALLTGFGGDEIMAGDLQSAILDDASLGNLGAVPNALRTAALLTASEDFSAASRVSSLVLRPLVKPLSSHAIRRWRRKRAFRTEFPYLGPLGKQITDEASAHMTMAHDVPRTASERYWNFAERIVFEEYMDLRALLEETVGIVRIDSLLSERLLRFLSALPPRWLLSGGFVRGLFRRAFLHRMPESVRLRTTKASFEDMIGVFAGTPEARKQLASLGESSKLADCGIVDGSLFRSAIAKVLACTTRESFINELGMIWSFLAAESFLRKTRS